MIFNNCFAILLIASLHLVNAKEVVVTHKVKFEISHKNHSIGTITLALFGNIAPKTVKNFISFANEEGYRGLSYKGTKFHRIISRFMIQGGDLSEQQDGRGSVSIYGPSFEDENFDLSHSEPGILSMANKGKDTNGSQFFITTTETHWLDGKHTVFGKVLNGMDVIKEMENVPTDSNDKPIDDLIIINTSIEELKEIIQLKQ